jgi:hypothetical protein
LKNHLYLSNLLLPWAKRQPAIQSFKDRPVKKRTIWGTFGPKFPFFFLLDYGQLRAAGVPIGPLCVTAIGQQNPTMTPKTVGFARKKKQAQIPIFDLEKKRDRFFRCTFCVLVEARGRPAAATRAHPSTGSATNHGNYLHFFFGS